MREMFLLVGRKPHNDKITYQAQWLRIDRTIKQVAVPLKIGRIRVLYYWPTRKQTEDWTIAKIEIREDNSPFVDDEPPETSLIVQLFHLPLEFRRLSYLLRRNEDQRHPPIRVPDHSPPSRVLGRPPRHGGGEGRRRSGDHTIHLLLLVPDEADEGGDDDRHLPGSAAALETLKHRRELVG